MGVRFAWRTSASCATSSLVPTMLGGRSPKFVAAEPKALFCSAVVNRPASGVAREVLEARAFAVSFCCWCAVLSAPLP